MIKPEKHCEDEGERKCNADILGFDVPKIHEPTTVCCWKKCFANGKSLDMDLTHVAEVDKACEEHDSERRAVVFYELAHIALEKRALAYDAAPIGDNENTERDHYGQVEGDISIGYLACQHLHALLKIDEGDIEAKSIAGEARDVAKAVTRIRDSEEPMHYHCPTMSFVSKLYSLNRFGSNLQAN